MVRQHAAALMDAMIADHERSTGPWEIEWIVLPEAFCLMAGALKQSRFVLEGLEVDADDDARQHRPHQRPGDDRGGDDGAWAATSAANTRTTWSTTSAAKR